MDSKTLLGLVSDKLKDEDERKRLAQKLLNEEGGIMNMTAFINKGSGQMMTLKEVIEKEGREKAEQIVLSMLESLAENQGLHATQITADEANLIRHKIKTGEATDEEIAIAKLFEDGKGAMNLRQSNGANMVHLITQTFIDLIHFANIEVFYEPYFGDFLTAILVLMTGSLVMTPSSILYKHKNTSSDALISMGDTVADDIEKA